VRHGEAPTAVAVRRSGTSPRWSSSHSSPAFSSPTGMTARH